MPDAFTAAISEHAGNETKRYLVATVVRRKGVIAVCLWKGHEQHVQSSLRPDLQDILLQSYDCLTIISKLRLLSTCDERLIYQRSRLFLGRIFLQNRKIVGDSVVY